MGKKIGLDKLELLSKYPEYSGRKNVDIQRWTMFPIGVKSDHHGEQVTFTKVGANSIIAKMKDMPVMYTDGEYIPTKHRDEAGNRNVVGTTIGGGIFTDEIGTEWAYTDALIYTDANKKIYNDIIENQDELGTSIEADVDIDGFRNIHNADYKGLSILSNKHSAWKTEVLVADKGDNVSPLEVTYDDLMKKVIGDNYNTQLEDKDKVLEENKLQFETQLEDLKKQVDEKEGLISKLNTENNELRDLNVKFSNLIK